MGSRRGTKFRRNEHSTTQNVVDARARKIFYKEIRNLNNEPIYTGDLIETPEGYGYFDKISSKRLGKGGVPRVVVMYYGHYNPDNPEKKISLNGLKKLPTDVKFAIGIQSFKYVIAFDQIGTSSGRNRQPRSKCGLVDAEALRRMRQRNVYVSESRREEPSPYDY
jgi:hypothetical protein